jgi:hypothetical protein
VPRQCGDFWTVIYPGPPRAVEANPCKFRLLAGNRGLQAGNLMPDSPLSNRMNLS